MKIHTTNGTTYKRKDSAVIDSILNGTELVSEKVNKSNPFEIEIEGDELIVIDEDGNDMCYIQIRFIGSDDSEGGIVIGRSVEIDSITLNGVEVDKCGFTDDFLRSINNKAEEAREMQN